MCEEESKDKALSGQWTGIMFAIVATMIFAGQDAITKKLVVDYPVAFIIMLRCWVFFLAGFFIIATAKGGLKANIITRRPLIQCFRGITVVIQWILAGIALRFLGLAEVTALYETYPFFGTILAAIVLKEYVGWRRYVALCVGFLGVLIMLRPGSDIMSLGAVCALGGALLFAIYMILTRLVSQYDTPQTSFFYVGLIGTLITTLGIPFFWVEIQTKDIIWFIILCTTSICGHFCIIKALSLISVTLLQPFNYLQLIWSVLVGFLVFHMVPDLLTFLGAMTVVASGLFVFFREYIRRPKIQT